MIRIRKLDRAPRQLGDESGFTLIELIVVVAIMPIILGAIATALISLLSLQSSVSNRIGDSNDALIASTYFNRDVQSAQLMTTQSTVACPTSNNNGTQILGLEWGANSTPPASGGPVGGYDTVVSYVSTPVMNPTHKTTYALTRQLCTFGTPTASTPPVVTTTVARDIGTTPTVTIYGGKNNTGAFADITANFASWFPSLGVTKVQFHVNGQQTQSQYDYSLVGLPGLSKSQSNASVLNTPSSTGCGFATLGSGTYSTQLCFADFSSYNWTKASSGTCTPPGQPTEPGQLFQLGIASTPYTVSFCLHVSTNDVQPFIIPTYYNPSGDNSEAFLGNNGFYTGIPGKPALYQNAATLVTASFTDIQVLDAAGHPASGWTVVTGDAESTDTNEWMEYSNTTSPGINWSILPNNGSADLFGNACYDDANGFTNNSGLLQWKGPVPPTDSAVGNPSNAPPSSANAAALTINTSTYATGVNGILCESDQQLNKTGTLMLQSSEPLNSTASQSFSVTMQGAGLEALFFGVLV